jgi:hypothetical protein
MSLLSWWKEVTHTCNYTQHGEPWEKTWTTEGFNDDQQWEVITHTRLKVQIKCKTCDRITSVCAAGCICAACREAIHYAW